MCIRKVCRNLLGIHGGVATLHHGRICNVKVVGYAAVFFGYKIEMCERSLEFIVLAEIRPREAPVEVFGGLVFVRAFGIDVVD